MISEIELSSLRSKILDRINQRARLETKIKLAVFGATFLSSVFGLIGSVRYTAEELYSSNFMHYLSLILTDTGALFAYSKEFILSLAESLPLIGITLLLLTTFIMLSSVRLAVKNIKPIFLSA